MKRREFLALLTTIGITFSETAIGQGTDHVRRIAMLLASNASDPEMQARLAAFQKQLNTLGWTEGANIHVELRWFGGDATRAQEFAQELVGLSPDVIVANGTPGIEAVHKVTRSVPTVFVMVGNPVGSGYVASLAHPGGNVTGFSAFEPAIASKWMQILKEIAPATKRVTVLFYPDYEFLWRGAETGAAAVGVEVTQATCRSTAEIERALILLAGRHGDALVVLPTPLFAANRQLIVQLAARDGLPAIYPFRYYATAGGLMSYGIDAVDVFRRASLYVDRILKGENPSDLPVQAPTKFEFVINLKTAKALGLAVPSSVLATADEVIE
jgi:ABC-type uncharacterized transport system substrate-binding protein